MFGSDSCHSIADTLSEWSKVITGALD